MSRVPVPNPKVEREDQLLEVVLTIPNSCLWQCVPSTLSYMHEKITYSKNLSKDLTLCNFLQETISICLRVKSKLLNSSMVDNWFLNPTCLLLIHVGLLCYSQGQLFCSQNFKKRITTHSILHIANLRGKEFNNYQSPSSGSFSSKVLYSLLWNILCFELEIYSLKIRFTCEKPKLRFVI